MDFNAVIVGLSVLAVLLTLSALFSAAETAWATLTAAHLRELQQHPRRGEHIDILAQTPEKLFAALVFGNTIVNTIACVTGYFLASACWTRGNAVISFLVMLGLLYFCGEVIPKSLVVERAGKFALTVAPVLTLWLRIVSPVLRLGDHFSQLLCRTFSPAHWQKEGTAHTTPTEDEYLDLLEDGEKLGLLIGEERTMIARILQLNSKRVSDIMTPRADTLAVKDSMTREQMIAAFKQIKHRRVPVLTDSGEEIVGIINTREMMLNPDRELDEVIELPSYVPETMNCARLLQTFHRGGHEMAIVVDEYGSAVGVVTIEDIVEEIVGDIEDEFDVRELLAQTLNENSWLFNGKTHLDQVNELLGANLASPGVDTIGGWFLAKFGAFPKEGDQLRHEQFAFTARRVGKNRIREILVERAVSPTPSSPPSTTKRRRKFRERKPDEPPPPPAPSTKQPDLPFAEGGAP